MRFIIQITITAGKPNKPVRKAVNKLTWRLTPGK